MDIKVSIVTTAYNHAPYIRQALDSFLMQKTDFAFEVIVHDDASTDGTADIIRAYAEKYPDIIVPILQTENQYSQGVSPYNFIDPMVRGKYIALCEGDDYWCDENKLQHQYDYMESHPECSYCCCNSYDVDVDGNVIGTKELTETGRVFSSEEMISANGDFCANAGSFYRTKDEMEYDAEEFPQCEAGDVPFRCYLALRGNTYCFPEKMVCYRRFVPGSWTLRVQKGENNEQRVQWKEDLLNYYQHLKIYADGKYQEAIDKQIHKARFQVYREKIDLPKLKESEFIDEYKQLPLKQKAIITTKYHFPWAVKAFRFIRYGKKGLARKY